jgi:hypothetical protein
MVQLLRERQGIVGNGDWPLLAHRDDRTTAVKAWHVAAVESSEKESLVKGGDVWRLRSTRAFRQAGVSD